MNATNTWIARLFLLGLIVFAIYYPYMLLSQFVPFAFSGDASWQSHWMVDDTAMVPFAVRFGQFMLWMPTVIATQLMLLAAIWLVLLLLRGTFFDLRTVRALQWVGAFAALAGFTALVAIMFDARIVTSYNAEYKEPIRLHLESGEVGVLLVGLGLFLLARVLMVAVLKDRENKAFV